MNHLEGDVRIDLGQAQPVTLHVAPDDDVMIRWPSGFRLIIEPTPQVVDTLGRPIATDGTHMSFPPVGVESAAGTSADPYILLGRIGGTCYVATQVLG